MPNKNAPSPRFKRKQIYIKKDFQTRFIIRFLLILLLGGAISIGLIMFNTQGTLTSAFVNSKLVIQSTALAILPSVIFTTIITTLVLGIIVVLVTLVVSHKIAGPMYRFEKDIDRVAAGDLKHRIHIRQGDQFQEMVTALNTMITELNRNLSDIREDVAAFSTHPDLPESLRQDIHSLKHKIESRFIL